MTGITTSVETLSYRMLSVMTMVSTYRLFLATEPRS